MQGCATRCREESSGGEDKEIDDWFPLGGFLGGKLVVFGNVLGYAGGFSLWVWNQRRRTDREWNKNLCVGF